MNPLQTKPYPLAIFLFLVFLWYPGAKMGQIRYTEWHSMLPQGTGEAETRSPTILS